MNYKSVKIRYTTTKGGEFNDLEVHSVFLPDGSIYDATLGGWRSDLSTWTNPRHKPKITTYDLG